MNRQFSTLNIRNEGAVRIVELDRPQALNAFSSQLMDDLADAFIEATSDGSVKVLLLTGAGKAFSAGADLNEMGRQAHKPKHGFEAMLDYIVDFPKPFMLAVNGLGVGIGATICGLADFVYMSDKARLRCPFSSLGLTAEAASTMTFPRLMGHQRAAWFLMSAEWMSAQECLAAGLALEVFPHEEFIVRTLEQAQKLAALPLASLVQTKALVMDPIRQQLKDVARIENRALGSMVGQPANREALAAFREKRPADFTGL